MSEEVGSASIRLGVKSTVAEDMKQETDKASNDFRKLSGFMSSELQKVMSPTEQLAANVAKVEEAVRRGMITEQQASRIRQRMTEATNQMNASASVGAKGVGRMNNAVTQLSYGAQDFVQVLDQGVAASLRASANNISQWAAVMFGAKGALVGIGITALAMAPSIIKAFKDGKSEAKKMQEFLERFEKYLRRADFTVNLKFTGIKTNTDARRIVEDAAEAGTAKDTNAKLQQARRSREDLMIQSRQAQTDAIRPVATFMSTLSKKQQLAVGTQLVTPGFKGSFSAPAAQKKAMDAFAEMQRELAKGRLSGDGLKNLQGALRAIRGATTGEGKKVIKKDAFGKIETPSRKGQEEYAKNRKEFDIVSGLIDRLEALSSKFGKKEAIENQAKADEQSRKDRVAALVDQAKAEEITRKSVEQATKKAAMDDAERKKKSDAVQRDILRELNPDAAKIMDIGDTFKKRQAVIDADPLMSDDAKIEQVRRAREAAEKSLAAVGKATTPDRQRQAQFTGIASLGREIQQSLMPDKNKKTAEETAKNTKNTADNSKATADAMKTVTDLLAPFGNAGVL